MGYIIKAVPQIDEHSGAYFYFFKSFQFNYTSIYFLEKNTHIKEIRAGRKVPVQAVLSELLKSTRYAISISCYNSAGQGPLSSVVYQQTRGGGTFFIIEETYFQL